MTRELREVVLGASWRCNSRCQICDIWKREPKGEELPAAEYAALPPGLRRISLGGSGEPFLRQDLVELVWVLRRRCPSARIVLVTNGFAPKLIAEKVAQMPRDIVVRVSLDGIGAVHETVRGVPGGYDKVLETLGILRGQGIANLGVGFALNDLNSDDAEKVLEFAKHRGLKFALTLVQDSDLTFGEKSSRRPPVEKTVRVIESIKERLLQSGDPRDWVTAYFLDGLQDHALGKPRSLPCMAGHAFCYVDPSGSVYPCHILGRKMGQIENGQFPSLLQGNDETLDYVAHCPRQCWMTCTVTATMKRVPLGPLWWMLKNRTRTLLLKRRRG